MKKKTVFVVVFTMCISCGCVGDVSQDRQRQPSKKTQACDALSEESGSRDSDTIELEVGKDGAVRVVEDNSNSPIENDDVKPIAERVLALMEGPEGPELWLQSEESPLREGDRIPGTRMLIEQIKISKREGYPSGVIFRYLPPESE